MTKPRLIGNESRVSRFLAFFCTAALWSTAQLPARAEPLQLLTEAYPPYNYQEDGLIKGIAVDLVKAVTADAGIEYEMKIQPWARAYGLALNTAGHCVFSTVHTPERDALFEWVEPLFSTEQYLVRKTGSNVNPANIEDAKRYLVGTQLGDYTEGILKQGGFSRVDLTSEIDLTIKKLLAGRIDLMPMAASMVTDLQKKAVPVEPAVIFTRSVDSLACNKKTAPETLAKMRASLKKLIADGTQAGIFQRYKFTEGGLLPTSKR
ncbi:polar amino acid transport system substrate-binding protein [Rhizobium aquaticum]|uniref:Polar amino acid transport system substrate-binding protein n=1 Tax=Rhizobium aquaticum TaxID=1549636 RepID=A0ABV2IU19_9HYPH